MPFYKFTFFPNSELYPIGPLKAVGMMDGIFPGSKRKMVICPAVDTLLDQMFTNFFEEILQRTHPHSAAVCELELQPRTKPVETHYKNTYFFHSPWQKCLPSQIKRPFPPSPFAMLFVITKEMHTWAVRPKQHCNRGGEGGEFVPFGHQDCMARNWKLHWNVSTVLSGVVAKKITFKENAIKILSSIESF